jgi:hypothetical protein
MIITLDNLRAGIVWFGQKWGADLINGEYYQIYDAQAGGITADWWAATVDRLSAWHALRPTLTKAALTAVGGERLYAIATEYRRIRETSTTGAPNIVEFEWEAVAPLFTLLEMKPRSQVFPSKLGHFIFPNLFTVIDNLATGVIPLPYEFYWRGIKDEWHRFSHKAEARRMVAEAIYDPLHPVHARFPFETKIMELSHIGYTQTA